MVNPKTVRRPAATKSIECSISNCYTGVGPPKPVVRPTDGRCPSYNRGSNENSVPKPSFI